MSLTLVVAILGVVSSVYAGFYEYIDKSLGADFVLIPNGLILGGGNGAPLLGNRRRVQPQVGVDA